MRRISEWRHNKDKHKRNPRIFLQGSWQQDAHCGNVNTIFFASSRVRPFITSREYMSSPKQPEPSSLMGISFDDSPQPISGVRCESETTQEDPSRLPGGGWVSSRSRSCLVEKLEYGGDWGRRQSKSDVTKNHLTSKRALMFPVRWC